MSQRIQYIGIAKLIGLALVCFCHIPMPEGMFHVWVYSFHMPFFFFLSGMFFKPEKVTLRNTLNQLLIPFAAFNVIAILFNVGLNFLLTHTIQFPEIMFSDLLKSKYIIGPSWFLLSLFCIRLFCGKLYRFLKIQGLVAISILFLLVFYFTRDAVLWNILSLGSTLLGLPFFLLGFLFKNQIFKYINKGGIWG